MAIRSSVRAFSCALAMLVLLAGCGSDKKTDTAASTPQSGSQRSSAATPTATPSTTQSSVAAVPDKPIASAPGSYLGVKLQVLAVTRTDPSVVTLNFRLVNEGDQMFNEHTFQDLAHPVANRDDISGTYLVDEKGGKKYLPLHDEQGGCICTESVPPLDPGESADFFAKFPAPPAGVTSVAVVVNHFPAVTAPLS